MKTKFPWGKMLRRATVLVVAAFGLPAWSHLQAQTVNVVSKSGFDPVKHKTALQEAYAAFKSGDTATALSKITPNLRTGASAAHADLQTGSQLAEIACRLKSEGDTVRSAQVAAFSLGKLAQPQGRMTVKDSAAALALAGQLYDHVLGDATLAQQAYTQALAADPTQKAVAERLAFLKAVEDNARAKAVANEVLRQRNLQSRR